jgi:hypothetical protein
MKATRHTQGGRGILKTAGSSVVVLVVVARFGLTGHSWCLQAHLKGETHFEPLDAGPSKCGARGQSNFPTKSDVQFPCCWVGHPILGVPDQSVSAHTEQPGPFRYFLKGCSVGTSAWQGSWVPPQYLQLTPLPCLATELQFRWPHTFRYVISSLATIVYISD